ncbi:MAG: DUF3305 domain-containing protein [Thiothrix sp.]|nr:DUF3305 domain-containing protein [Thiothrix sp.]HPE61396.1 DUF3305 domain-containing protein [Thiolinea sp.]
MQSSSPVDTPAIPEFLPVSVMMERRPSTSRWSQVRWVAAGVVVGASEYRDVTLLHEQDGVAQFLYPGLKVQLHPDECESYYHNLCSPRPGCYVLADPDASTERPAILKVTLCFDEANAYLQGALTVYALSLPPALYHWLETYVVANHVPVKRTKRRRTRWSDKGDHNAGATAPDTPRAVFGRPHA